MKKVALLTLLSAIGFAFTAFVTPKTTDGNAFEGVITYSIDVNDPQAASMIGSSLTLYVKGDKTKKVQDGMFARMIFEDANKPHNPVVLINAMGNKYLLKNDPTKNDTATPVIKYEDGTKKIAGYVCSKAEITTTEQGEAITAIVYYTEELVSAPVKAGAFKGLKGFPLQYSFAKQGVNISFTATKVKQQSLPDDTFTPHTSGYKPMTEDEIKADIQQNMQRGN